ncbi:hypothetical protein [Nocardiopsis deserti]|uniref:hypothetical protein n=1 Tax=Nocardiopsis deserti TaxID=2605988 RepID=UPI00123AD731|nr:hypothetical protein [Nocardiopsis deserti]
MARKILVSLATATAFASTLCAASPASAAPTDSQATETGRVQVSASCYTQNTDLYCDNRPGSPLYAHRDTDSPIRDYLYTSHSWFDCWGPGERHAGGNSIWYWTQGDQTGEWGNIPAVNVFTTTDPPPGINQC